MTVDSLDPPASRTEPKPIPATPPERPLFVKVRPGRFERTFDLLAHFSPIVLLAVWEAVAQAGLLDRRFFPAPSGILDTLVADFASGDMMRDIVATLSRVAVGYAGGAIPAILAGLTLGLFAAPRQIFTPILQTLYSVPKIAIFPLILLVFGIGEMSKYVIIGIGVFFLVFFNTLAGVLETPRIYFDVAKNAGANRAQIYITVALPAALPSIFTGLKLAMGHAYVLIAASEFVGAKNGVGYYIWQSWQLFSVPRMFAGILVISVLGYASMLAIELLQRLIVPQTGRGTR